MNAFRLFFAVVGFLFTSSTALALPLDPVNAQGFQNILKPFSTDGCSSFPDGIPLFKPNLWLNCCIEHDVAYWQGGSSQQRESADAALAQCVNDVTYIPLGSTMWAGVRIGGHGGLPTSWHWGYGWTLDRGDETELDIEEMVQVQAHLKNIPKDFSQLRIEDSYFVRDRESITGNVCLDQTMMYIREKSDKKTFSIQKLIKTEFQRSGYPWVAFEVTTDHCSEPYKIEFQLLRKDACFTKNELVARNRIRLRAAQMPSRASCN